MTYGPGMSNPIKSVFFIVVKPGGFLGSKVVTAGNVEKYYARFNDVLNEGVHVSGATVTTTSLFSTQSSPVLDVEKTSLSWVLTTTVATEVFTTTLVVTLSDGQVLNYTIQFVVVPPSD